MDRSPGFDPLRNVEQMASLIANVTGEPAECVIEALDYERRHPGSTVANDFRKRGGPRYQWGPHLETFYSSTNAFLYELAVWNRNFLKGALRRWTSGHMARQGRPLERPGHRRRARVRLPAPGPQETPRHLFRATRHQRAIRAEAVRAKPPGHPRPHRSGLHPARVLRRHHLLRCPRARPRPGFDGQHAGIISPPRRPALRQRPFYMILPWYPTHLKSNRRFSGSLNLFRQAGLHLIGGQLTWSPIVLRKSAPSVSNEPATAPPSPGPITIALRITGAIQAVGRVAAWPFILVHFFRWTGNRRFEGRPAGESAEASEPEEVSRETPS